MNNTLCYIHCLERSFDLIDVCGTSSLKMELLFVILVLACLRSFVLPDAQGDALYLLKNSLNATSNQLADWNQHLVNPCTWSKVICDNNYNVTAVTLSNMGFCGTLSPKLGILKTLTTLSLQGNGITGHIPEELGNLTSLTMLDLSNNHLSGEIPASFGNLKKLHLLILSQNNLSGTIPQSLTSLPSLFSLQLGFNGLTGQIPDQLLKVSEYNFTGNNLNCGLNFAHRCESDNGGSSSKLKVGVIVGIVAEIFCILLLGGLLLFLWKGRQRGYKREVIVDVAGLCWI